MNRLKNPQQGASAIATVIVLAILAYAVYIGIQYVPLEIESKAIDSILDTLQTEHKTDPFTDEQDAKTKVINLLQINEMNDMTKSFTVKRVHGALTVNFTYDRELNLGYEKRPMHYEKSLVLK